MALVKCDVFHTHTYNDDGHSVAVTRVVCNRCEREVESYGDDESSLKRCFALLRQDCGNDENNWYIEEPSEDNTTEDMIEE